MGDLSQAEFQQELQKYRKVRDSNYCAPPQLNPSAFDGHPKSTSSSSQPKPKLNLPASAAQSTPETHEGDFWAEFRIYLQRVLSSSEQVDAVLAATRQMHHKFIDTLTIPQATILEASLKSRTTKDSTVASH
eukprot:TRINITY_DN11299_c0_g1::TRINITY_DN11299_c0_g1_i1::g.699::m.699 TRINITY_DN11299_c0_g1::TRINITY_DN11299_c0_g1_i1::g.699  ORF type:complete len:145 (+),score=2.35,DUF4048/PF13257.1/0.017 TRINITY_DN11299_c0_g1_i1:40-435(+)